MLADAPYQPKRSLFAKIKRRLTQYHYAAPVRIETNEPILSITFDDCPESAITLGARILDEYGVKGGFYIASDLIGKKSHMGRIAREDQIRELRETGHEIGSHTHTHLDCAANDTDVVVKDVEANLTELARICPDTSVASFAFPYGETSFSAKRKLSGRFLNLRGILPGINRGSVDRAQLRAFEIDQSESSFARAMSALSDLQANPGWMITFTHDVSDQPSEFGMTPEQLRTLINEARARGIRIETPTVAANILGLTTK